MRWTTPLRQAHARRGSPFNRLKIALIADDLTRTALGFECRVRDVTDKNYRALFERWRPDLLLVESCWSGRGDAWRYSIASYPDVPERNNAKLKRVVEHARSNGIPAIFWNREDGVHFDRFIDSAKLFDRVLTVDETTISSYRAMLDSHARIGTMMFAASRHLHRPSWQEPRCRAAFVGSYSTHVHDHRQAWQDAMFDAARPVGLTIYDRNSARNPDVYRFPERPWIETHPAIPHERTPQVYRDYMVNLNVNTIVNSRTAFSRRLVEILGCGGFVLTNRSKAIDAQFPGLCFATDDAVQAEAFFDRVAREGLSRPEERMRHDAAAHVEEQHCWPNRIPILLDMASG